MSEPISEQPGSTPHIGLFVTCLVDLYRPSVAFAAIQLLEAVGCRVSVPETQTCCGQPAYNSGDRADAVAILRGVVAAFESFDAVVVPSGSCAGMLVHHAPLLLADDPNFAARADALAAKTFELTAYLAHHAPRPLPPATFAGTVTYHDSCSSLREMGVAAEPRALLAAVEGLTLTELENSEECCGFGGLFAVKYPEISDAMVTAKAGCVVATAADLVVGGDLGCLLNIAGKLECLEAPVRVRHVAEVLAGMIDGPAIGEGRRQ